MNKHNESPIDIVITWVDGSDPAWLAERARYSGDSTVKLNDDWTKGEMRFRDWDTLRYWFRGIEKFCPWARKVFFITWGHVPEWLNTDNEKLVITKHEDYVPEKYLPTFNSHTLEFNMHLIPGLSEQFIYFNDDMYAISPLKESQFFRNGKPCDCVGFNALSRNEYNKTLLQVNNVAVINRHFDKNEVLRKHPLQWFNPKYGSIQLRTLLLLPWPRFVGFYEHHTAYPFLKSTFEELWEAEYDELDNTCSSKFRAADNVTPWLFRAWQYCSGNFVPISPKFRQAFGGDLDDRVFAAIKEQKYGVICVNDDIEDQQVFLKNRMRLQEAFECILPEKCSFEK